MMLMGTFVPSLLTANSRTTSQSEKSAGEVCTNCVVPGAALPGENVNHAGGVMKDSEASSTSSPLVCTISSTDETGGSGTCPAGLPEESNMCSSLGPPAW